MDCLIKDGKKGFTLIEMLVSIAIGTLIMGIGLSLFYAQRKSFSVQEQISEMQQNLRAGMHVMSREIRMAGYGTTSTNIFTVFETGTITFYADLDDDGTAEEITYKYDVGDSEIERKEEEPPSGPWTQPIAENIDVLSFSYGTDIITGATNAVTISITARTSKSDPGLAVNGNDGYRRRTLTSIVEVRNQ